MSIAHGVAIRTFDYVAWGARFVESITSRETRTGLGLLQALRQKARTLQGQNADQQSFAKYSNRYARYRSKEGRQATPVNLNFSGEMLAGMVPFLEGREGVRVGFANKSAEDKAVWNSEIKNRQFTGVNNDDLDALEKEVLREVDAALRGGF